MFTDFQINRLTIANEFCENLEIDENCQGTCHYVKVIKKESPEKKKSPFTSSDHKEQLLFLVSFEGQTNFNNELRKSPLALGMDLLSAYSRDVYHPPKLSTLC